MDAGVYPVTVTVVNTQQLHATTKFLGNGDILGGNLGNTRHMNLLEIHTLAAAEASQQGRLVGRVDTLDIEGRVRFGKAKALSVLQHHVKVQAFIGHTAEDVVASTVDNAAEAFYRRAKQTFLQTTDDRNTTTNGSFEQHMQALLGSQRENLVTVLGKESLVGSHHMLAGIQSGQNPLAGHIVATGQFHQHIDIVTGNHLVGIGRNLVALFLVWSNFHIGLGANAGQFQFDSQLFLVFGDFLFQNLDNTTTDGSRTNKTYTQHKASPF